MRVGLYTLGCKVSQYETEAIAEEFSRRGLEVVPYEDVADAYVINTCTVTQESDRKSRQIIRRAITRNPSAVIAVVGCYSQRDSEGVLAIPGVDIVLGTDGKLGVVDRVIERLERGRGGSFVSISDLSRVGFEPMCVTGAPRTRAYVKIEDGCECKCTYCAIADARGRVRSKAREDVIREVEGQRERGTLEVVLTGIEIGSYGRDLGGGYDLADLICELDARRSVRRIRLGSLAPELVGADFAKKISGTKILVPHFHISMQSGSDSVLRRMKRRYTRDTALCNIERLRELFPRAQFTSDLMVGFPGESDADFALTADFVRRARLLDSHVFAYSRRKNTPAWSFEGQIPEDIKRSRSRELSAVQGAVTDSILEELVLDGEPLICILESETRGVYTAHSDSYVEVRAEAERGLSGKLVKIAPVSHKGGIIYGKIIEICK
ncbi:MAG: tRNA (N(6)-L-threonylcarbamoyladenosine(37)-C(2))-methylthiotransferase MtaB [Clostridia bacterium]|nr:tRNA (N(6)-L-threonylcarbamoyladenosine(37)-C(2))-methylthiotransferase MtaB [Clostridia bacterium]